MCTLGPSLKNGGCYCFLDAIHFLICCKTKVRKTSGDFFFNLGEARDYEAQSCINDQGMPPALMAT